VPVTLTEYDTKLRDAAMHTVGKPLIFPIEIYLLNARKQEFVWKGQLSYGNSSDLTVATPNGTLLAEPWNEDVRKILGVAGANL